jgi:hypothetical protein
LFCSSSQLVSATFRNIATLQLSEEISRVHRASPGVLVESKYFLNNRLEAWVGQNRDAAA